MENGKRQTTQLKLYGKHNRKVDVTMKIGDKIKNKYTNAIGTVLNIDNGILLVKFEDGYITDVNEKYYELLNV